MNLPAVSEGPDQSANFCLVRVKDWSDCAWMRRLLIKLLSFRHHLERRFCLAFYFKWQYFVLIDHILSVTIWLFLFSKNYPNINFTAKHWSDLWTFFSKVIFVGKFVKENNIYFILLNLYNWCFTTILWKFEKIWEKLNKRNLLKFCLQVTYPTHFCIICIHFYCGEKVKIFDFLKRMTRIIRIIFFMRR